MFHRIALSPWARAALPTEVERELEDRAARADLLVSTVKRAGKNGLWLARAFRRGRSTQVEFVGRTVADAVLGAIEKHEAQFFTADELLQIQRQSA